MSENIHNVKLLAILFFLATAVNWQYGFSSTYLNTPVDQFKIFINESLGSNLTETKFNLWWDLIQNIWFLGFFIGIFLGPVINDTIGRKKGMILANIAILLASIIQWLSIVTQAPVLLVIGRAIASTFTAVSFAALVLYLQEAPPTNIRGTASFLSEITFALFCIEGTMLGTDQLLGNNLPWLLASIIPVCIFGVVFLFFVPETSKFLIMRRADRSMIERSVLYFHGKGAGLGNIIKETEIELSQDDSSARSIFDLIRIPHLRKALFLSVCCLQNCICLWMLIYNSTLFLEDINIDSGIAQWSATVMMIVYFLFTVIGGSLVERWGRRKILLPFTSLNVASIALFTLFTQLHKLADFWKWFAVADLMFYAVTYGFGVGGISWFISAELTPTKYRSLMQSACYSINTISVVISTFVVLPFYYWIGTYCFLILYTIPSCFALFYVARNLPETRGRPIHKTVEELKQ